MHVCLIAVPLLLLLQVEGQLCAKNILLTGGNANLPGYEDRFRRDIRQYVPEHWHVNVSTSRRARQECI